MARYRVVVNAHVGGGHRFSNLDGRFEYEAEGELVIGSAVIEIGRFIFPIANVLVVERDPR